MKPSRSYVLAAAGATQAWAAKTRSKARQALAAAEHFRAVAAHNLAVSKSANLRRRIGRPYHILSS